MMLLQNLVLSLGKCFQLLFLHHCPLFHSLRRQLSLQSLMSLPLSSLLLMLCQLHWRSLVLSDLLKGCLPQFIDQIRRGNQIEKQFNTEVIHPSIASKSTLKEVQRLLRDVVENPFGTAHKLYDPYFSMAGKTGSLCYFVAIQRSTACPSCRWTFLSRIRFAT